MTQSPIAAAVRLLRENAEELKQSHTLAGLAEWPACEDEVKAVYDEQIAVAAALEAMLNQHHAQEVLPITVDVPASGAVALSEYLKTCEQQAIVPDVGGAFASAFKAGFKLSVSHAVRGAVAEQALLKVLHTVQHYLPPDGVSARDTLTTIIEVVDPWPLDQAPSAVTVPDEREAFEQAFIAEKLRLMDCSEPESATHAIRMCHLKRYEDGEYPTLEAYFAWFAWQARAALAATPAVVNASETPNSSTIAIPRGWKLVPDDATPEWIENLEALPDWREAVGECIKKFLAAAPAAPQAAPAAVAVQLDANGIAQCPLCGSESKHVQAGVGGHRILCWNDDCECSSGYFCSKEEAITSWNARAALAATPAAAPTDEPVFLQRLRVEQQELDARQQKLGAFIESSEFRLLSETDAALLSKQEALQHVLLQTLNQRIHSASEKHMREKRNA